MKKFLSLIITFVVLSSISVIIVFAASAESNSKSKSANGYNYEFTASVHNNSSSAWAFTNLSNEDSENVPTGYMGVLPRLYDSNSILKKSGGWQYNSTSASGMGLSSGKIYTLGTYYSFGQVKLYDGNGYDTYDTYRSPIISHSGSRINIENKIKFDAGYKINKNGETYGLGISAITLGKEPDLIAAYGIDGTLGYVRSADFELENPTTPEEAKTNQNNRTRYIPLYDKDGETTIGSFKIESLEVTYTFD